MNFKTIGTHSGHFHCDDALACYQLKLLNKDAKIIRTRDLSVLDTCDVVVDIGGIYDPSKNWFDHHQRDFNHTANSLKPDLPYKIKLCGAGLIYIHFGEKVIEKILETKIDEITMSHIYKKIYSSFVREVDAIDNGINTCDYPKYKINTHVSKRVGDFNKNWNDKSEFNEDAAFAKAMELVGKEFEAAVKNIYNVWWPARKIVKEAIENRKNIYESGEIIEFEERLPFTEHIFDLEKELKIQPTIKFVIHKEGENWRLRTVSGDTPFSSRVPLLEEWRGLKGEELEQKGAPEGAIFVHATGFTGGHKTKQGIIEMAVKTLNAQHDKYIYMMSK